MDELTAKFGASGGDFAMAYVVSHEFGHHVQDELGINQSVQDQMQADPARQNDLSVRMELQADCLAGVWAHSAVAELEPGDIDEALNAAASVGDDRIQRRPRAGSTPNCGPTARLPNGPSGSRPATRAATSTSATRSAPVDAAGGGLPALGDTIRALRRSSSVVEQGTHKPLVGGSNPPSATSRQRSPTALHPKGR